MAVTTQPTDISIVLYGFSANDFGVTGASLVEVSGLVARVRILISGTKSDFEALKDMIHRLGLSEKADIVHRFDNLGFAAGHNFLLRRSFVGGAERCLLVNPDMKLSKQGLACLLAAGNGLQGALVGPSLAQLGAAEMNTDPERTDSLGIAWNLQARHFDIAQGKPWVAPTGAPKTVQGVTGACLLVSKDVFSTLVTVTGHFFDELFIAYREDAELGIRASRIGIKSVVVPVAGISHVRSQRGFKRTSPLVNLLGVRNRFLIKWTLGQYRPGSRLLSLLRDIVVVVATLVVERSSIPGLLEAWKVRRFARGMQSVLRGDWR